MTFTVGILFILSRILYLSEVHGLWGRPISKFYVTISNKGGTTARIDLAETRLRAWVLREDELEQERVFLLQRSRSKAATLQAQLDSTQCKRRPRGWAPLRHTWRPYL